MCVKTQVKSSQVVAKATELVAKATELVLKNTEWACHAAYRADTLHTACHAREGARVLTYSSTRHMGRTDALGQRSARAWAAAVCARVSARASARRARGSSSSRRAEHLEEQLHHALSCRSYSLEMELKK